jgi:hypothetical protein
MPPMVHREFLGIVLDRLEREAAAGVLPWEARVRLSMLQIHFGNPRVHYELWLQGRTGRAEVGLHFEDDAEVNAAWCGQLAERVFELRHRVGPELEPEDWTQSWQRLHLTIPLRPLDESFATELSTAFGALIEATHEDLKAGPPHGLRVRTATVAPSAGAGSGRRFRGRRQRQ